MKITVWSVRGLDYRSQRGKKITAGSNDYENAKNVIARWAARLVQRLDEEYGKK